MTRLILATLTAVMIVTPQIRAQQSSPALEKLFASAQHKATVEGDLRGAIDDYRQIVAMAGNDRAAAAQALLRIAETHHKLSNPDEAQRIYQRIVKQFADQNEAVAVARARLIREPAAPATKQAATQLWAKSGIQNPVDNTPSQDGRYIGFTVEGGVLGIHDFVTGTDRTFTDTAASHDYAGVSAVSADGRYIAFSWTLGRERRNELRVRPVNGSEKTNARTLFRSETSKDYMFPYGWTPDGKQLLVVHVLPDGATSQIAMMSVADGSFRAIKSMTWINPRVSLSPDGRYVAYYSLDNDALRPGERPSVVRNISVLAADGSSDTVLTRGSNSGRPIWTADGANVLFTDNRTGSWALWRAPVTEGKRNGAAQLVKELGDVALLATTRSGAVYYRAGGGRRNNVYVSSLGPGGTATGPATVAIDTFLNSNLGSSLSPNGEYLAYYSNNLSAGRLKIRRLATGQDRLVAVDVAAGPLAGAGPMWQADNRSLFVFAVDTERGGWGIHRIDVASARSRLIRRFPVIPRGAAVSPDGTALFYSTYDADNPQDTGRVVRIDLSTGQETEVMQGKEFVSLSVSGDSKYLAYIGTDRSTGSSYIAVIPESGGTPRELFRSPGWTGASLAGTLTWTADQQHLLFVLAGQATNSVNTIWRVPVGGGQPSRVQDLTGLSTVKNPHVHPDGRRMFFSASEVDPEEIWTLEHALPAPKSRNRQ